MVLLKLYLRPENSRKPISNDSPSPYLRPALDLISRHSPRLDAVETLQLLPPLVTASDVSEYLCEALRTPRIHVRVERELWKARSDQVSRALMELESKRVRITDTRLSVYNYILVSPVQANVNTGVPNAIRDWIEVSLQSIRLMEKLLITIVVKLSLRS
jgi:hypothetical protein